MSKKTPRGDRPRRARKGRYQPPSIERLRELFELRDGVLLDRRTGQPATTWPINAEGYHRIAVDGRQVRVHRAVLALDLDRWPTGVIDHLNGDPGDNRLENLLETDALGNNLRARRQRRSPVGRVGVRPRGDQWEAHIRLRGVRRRRLFATYEEAVAQREAWERELGFPERVFRRVTFRQIARRRALPRGLDDLGGDDD